MSPVPDDATVRAAFEPLAVISLVVTEPTVMLPSIVAPTLVMAPEKVPVVAVKAATSNGPAATVSEVDLSAAVAVVVPSTNESVSSFQTIAALLPAVPLSMIIPALLVFAEAPVFNSIMLSSIVVFVVLTIAEVPPTVRLPLIVTSKESKVIVFVPDPESNPSPAFMV